MAEYIISNNFYVLLQVCFRLKYNIFQEKLTEVYGMWCDLQMGYSAASSELSDRQIYPNFYRTGGSDLVMVAPMVELLKMHGWKIVATIHQIDPLFATVSLQTALV